MSRLSKLWFKVLEILGWFLVVCLRETFDVCLYFRIKIWSIGVDEGLLFIKIVFMNCFC